MKKEKRNGCCKGTCFVKNQLVEWRRHFHKYPELSFQEEKTSQFVFDILRKFPYLEVSRPTKYSVMAKLVGKHPGKTVAIRADMDALPIHEENEFDFISTYKGVMHACGHDGHIAILLGVVHKLVEEERRLKGRFVFYSNMLKRIFLVVQRRWLLQV